MWGINGLSAPGQVEPWPATPHCVVPACTVGWTRTPLTWFSASRDFLLPRGPNAAWAGAHPTAGEKPQAAPTLLRGSKGSEGKKQGLFHTPCLLPDLQDHLQFPGSKIQGLHRRRGSGGGGGGRGRDRQQQVLREPQRRQALPESTPRHALPPGPAGTSPLPTRSRTPACGPVGRGTHGAASGGCARPERCPPQLQGPSGSQSTRGWPSHGCPCCDRQH